MRLQTKSPDPAAAQKPSRTAARAARDRRHRGPAAPLPRSRRAARRRGESSARSLLRRARAHRSGGSERGTPPIPLTLRGMQGALRRQARSSARSVFLLPSVLALLALALFPVVARAECTTASCINYETKPVPEIETKTPKPTHTAPSGSKSSTTTNHKSSNTPTAEGSPATNAANGGSSNSAEAETESESEENGSSGGTPSNGGNSNPPKSGGEGGKQSTKPAVGSNPKTGDNVSPATPVASKDKGNTTESSGGGSSPIVPILIAVAVLAAISIGVVLYRQRNSGPGPDGP